MEYLDNVISNVKNEARQLFKSMLLEKRIHVDGSVSKEQRRELSYNLEKILLRLLGGYRKKIDKQTLNILKEDIIDEFLGYGIIDRFLEDPKITDIMVNSPDQIFIEKDGIVEKADVAFENERQIMSIIERMVSDSGKRIDLSSPFVDFRIKRGARVTAVIPPIAGRSPLLCVRKILRDVFSLDELLEKGTVNKKMLDFLKCCVRARINMLISGSTGVGKTTFMNLLIKEFIPNEGRVVILEDTEELIVGASKHYIKLLTRSASITGHGEVKLSDLVKLALHLRPDRIVIGEIRGGEAFDFLHVVNTGHDGSMCTIHANDCADALMRLETLSLMGRFNISENVVRRFLKMGIHLIIHMIRLNNGQRVVSQVSEFEHTQGGFIIKDIFSLHREIKDNKEVYEAKLTGYVPSFFDILKIRADMPDNFFELQ